MSSRATSSPASSSCSRGSARCSCSPRRSPRRWCPRACAGSIAVGHLDRPRADRAARAAHPHRPAHARRAGRRGDARRPRLRLLLRRAVRRRRIGRLARRPRRRLLLRQPDQPHQRRGKRAAHPRLLARGYRRLPRDRRRSVGAARPRPHLPARPAHLRPPHHHARRAAPSRSSRPCSPPPWRSPRRC